MSPDKPLPPVLPSQSSRTKQWVPQNFLKYIQRVPGSRGFLKAEKRRAGLFNKMAANTGTEAQLKKITAATLEIKITSNSTASCYFN